MDWNLLFFMNSLLLGVGLAMDAFSVSVANGLAEPDLRKSKMRLIGGTFGFFQAFMPMLGWFFVHSIIEKFQFFERFIPWIALILLLYIGGKMLVESIRNIIKGEDDEEYTVKGVTFGALMVQGIATSIDALSVGFTISTYNIIHALVCAIIIAVVTYIISMIGLHIGRTIGNRLSNKAEILGGIILIFIGVEIFVTSLF
ncbi:MAG: manganese efflux pump [Bacillota bacterium]|nr:manganese efflux pump [Bacillota bacterium]